MATTADFIILAVAGWINRRQQEAIAYLREENRVLREQLGPGGSCSRTTNGAGWL